MIGLARVVVIALGQSGEETAVVGWWKRTAHTAETSLSRRGGLGMRSEAGEQQKEEVSCFFSASSALEGKKGREEERGKKASGSVGNVR